MDGYLLEWLKLDEVRWMDVWFHMLVQLPRPPVQ